MDPSVAPLWLSRLQFAVTTLFHMLWPLLSIGLSLFMLCTEIAWLRTGRRIYYQHTRFWARLFLLSFGLGVASGLPLEFQFGTNWARFSQVSGGFFGAILGFEGAMAFMLEAAFLGISVFGWNRVGPRVHVFATAMVAVGASLSAFWIMVANSWMQTPTGVTLTGGRIVVNDYFRALFNPSLVVSFPHMWVACVETTLFFVAGISAWYILRARERMFFLQSFKIAVAAAIVIVPVQIFLGDLSGQSLGHTQPAKIAALEAHWQTNPPGEPASWRVVAWPALDADDNAWELRVPYVLSLLETHSLTGQVVGLQTFPKADRPPVVIPFYAFRLMVAIGFALLGLMVWAVWRWVRGGLSGRRVEDGRWFWRAWVAAIPLGFVATELGWAVREVGRQPWIIYGMMRTRDGVSTLPPAPPAVTLAAYTAIYVALLLLFIVFAARIVRRGPDLELALPTYGGKGREGDEKDEARP
jgi:cytochrome bd ubiquinol oxidase subunit I